MVAAPTRLSTQPVSPKRCRTATSATAPAPVNATCTCIAGSTAKGTASSAANGG